MALGRAYRTGGGFSLLEVVIATGIFAAAIVAVVGLLSPLTKRATDVIESETAARLAATIQSELERIGFDEAVNLTGGVGGSSEIELVATADASRVLLSNGPGLPPADNPVDDPIIPGLANHERYFHITLQQQSAPMNYVAGSGFLALRADVEWPYWIPDGPNSAISPAEGDPARRQRLSFFFALRS